MSTPNEYRQRETDRHAGLHYDRVAARERFAEPAADADPTSPAAIMKQRIAETDRLLAELTAIHAAAKAQQERTEYLRSLAPLDCSMRGEAPGSFL